MSMRRALGCSLAVLLTVVDVGAASSDVADAAMKGNRDAVRALLQRKADVNVPQIDGTTALHWAVRVDDLELAEMLIIAGANVSAATREGVMPLQLAAMNGNAAMLGKLIKAGADPNAPLTQYGDTALMMAARTGKTDAITVLLETAAKVNAKETWGGTTALMWAASEGHPGAVKVLLDHGADVNARSNFVPAANGRGFEGRTPVAAKPGAAVEEFASGSLTPLMLAAREGDVESARLLVAAGADVNAVAGDGKDALGLAIFNGNYETGVVPSRQQVEREPGRHAGVYAALLGGGSPQHGNGAELPVDGHDRSAAAHQEAARRRRQSERPRQQHAARPHARRVAADRVRDAVDARGILRRSRSWSSSCLSYGADPTIISKDGETMVAAAAGLGFIQGYSKGKPPAERLEIVKLFVELGADVNQADDYGITPLMVAANMGEVSIIQYLIDRGADLGAYDLGKKNDGAFGSSVEPLMPVDYAIGVGTFVPNNAIILHEEATALMTRLMKEKGIKHTHFRMHVERIHLCPGQRRSQGRDAGGDRKDESDPDRTPGGRHHWRPGSEGSEVRDGSGLV